MAGLQHLAPGAALRKQCGQGAVPGRAEAGVALVSVLLIVAVLAAVVYQLAARHSLSIAQSRNALGFDQALSYALGAEAFARQLLRKDYEDALESESGQNFDSLLEPWAEPQKPFEIEGGGVLEIQIRDLNRCFNLNALRGERNNPHLEQFKRLLDNLGIPRTVADAARDWVDEDEEVDAQGAEDGEYLLRQPGYRPANGPFVHISELRLLRDMEAEYLQTLQAHVCVLPEEALQININTATPQALAALADLDPIDLEAFVASEREYQNRAEVAEISVDFPGLKGLAGLMGPGGAPSEKPAPEAEDASGDEAPSERPSGETGPALTVASAYFEVQARAEAGNGIAMLTSVLHRDPSSGLIQLVSRDLGRSFHSLFQEVQDEDL